MTSAEAVQLLLDRFPSLIPKCGSQELYEVVQPYHAYECFADEVKARISDELFVKSACDFINELAESNDPMLDEAVHVATLENLGSDLEVSAKIRQYLRPPALKRLLAIEHDLYGR